MNVLLITASSITFELVNNDAYYTDEYEIYLNNELIKKTNRNVESIYGLKENTSYSLKLVLKNKLINYEFNTLNKTKIILKPNDKADNTKMVQEAIDRLTIDEVLVLDGVFHICSLFLRDNVSIELLKNTKLIGENDRSLYPILKASDELNGIVLGTWEGKSDDSFSSIITGLGVSNVTIYGEGIIDCEAEKGDWWINHREKRIARRPKGIFLHTCKNIYFEGITVCNTPSWNQHPFYSKNINYFNVNLLNPANSPTTDGIDPESCDIVNIIGTKISVGDDCIAIKSGKFDFAKKYRTPCSNVTIRNCLMEYGHGGVTLGSENSGGINNVYVSKCIFNMTDRGLRIKSQRGRGNLAIIKNINFDNIKMNKVKAPFVINAFYKAGNDQLDERFIDEYQEVSELTPSFDEFYFKNISCKDVAYGVGYFLGLPESMIKKVVLENIDISFDYNADEGIMAMTPSNEKFKNIGFYVKNVCLLELKNITYHNEPSKKFIINNVKEIKEC